MKRSQTLLRDQIVYEKYRISQLKRKHQEESDTKASIIKTQRHKNYTIEPCYLPQGLYWHIFWCYNTDFLSMYACIGNKNQSNNNRSVRFHDSSLLFKIAHCFTLTICRSEKKVDRWTGNRSGGRYSFHTWAWWSDVIGWGALRMTRAETAADGSAPPTGSQSWGGTETVRKARQQLKVWLSSNVNVKQWAILNNNEEGQGSFHIIFFFLHRWVYMSSGNL